MYTIKILLPYSLVDRSKGLVESVLCENLQWATAANDFIKFNSINAAKRFAEKYRIVEHRPILGSDTCPYIVGPYGGKYSIFTGRRFR